VRRGRGELDRWFRSAAPRIPGARRLRAAISPTARREALDGERLRFLLAVVLAPDSNCIDVGSHVGGVLQEMVRLAPAGRHIAYEPLPELCSRLRARFPEVDVREAALSNRSGESTFVHVRNQPGLSGLRRRSYPREPEFEELTVRLESLDASLPDGYEPSLIKIDVEGAEREVIEGAIETIVRCKPVVVFEHGKGAAPHYGTGPRDVYGLLAEHAGMRIFDLDGNGPFELTDFQRAFERGERWNFVAHA
jgi:FkbM family methyltransferase